jgi:hypothetical protein
MIVLWDVMIHYPDDGRSKLLCNVSQYLLDYMVLDFSSNLCVQPGSGAHPASCTMGTGGSFPGGKARPGRDADHSPPSSAKLRKSGSCTSCHPKSASMERNGTTLPFFYLHGGTFLKTFAFILVVVKPGISPYEVNVAA